MRTTQSFTFYCRDSKQNKQHLSPIELSIIINGKRLFINLPFKFNPAEFNTKKQTPVIKQAIQEWRIKIDTILVEMLQHNIPITADRLREYIRTGGIKSYTVEDMFNEFLTIQKQRIGTTLSKGVYRKYELVSELFFSEFDKTQECSALTNGVVRKFFTLLDNKYDNSTAAGYKTKYKAFITYGIDNDKIKINPFQGIKIVKEKKAIDYLSEAEIRLLMQSPIENESLARVRDCAVFQICSGIAYADIVSLQPEDLQEIDGTYIISKQRVKTGTTFTSVILPEGVEIWKRYNGKLPIISNQKYNCYLKTIGTICNIPTILHSHLFRHTYATRLINKGVALSTVSKTLGHTNTKMTETFYAHIEEKTIASEVAKAFL